MADLFGEWREAIQGSPELGWVEDLIDHLPIKPDILELASGAASPTTMRLAEVGNLLGVDFSERQVTRARERCPRARFVHADITEVNFDPESFDEAPGEEVDTSKREVDMAKQLIDSLTAKEFDPEKYHDTYREAVLDMIEKKAEGQEIVLQPVEEPEKVPDLMAALEASLAAAKEDGGDGAAAKPRRRQRASASNGADGAKKRSSSGRGSRSKSKS